MSSLVERWHEEMQSAWIYRAIASCEADQARARLFRGLADAAEGQAAILRSDLEARGEAAPRFAPSVRARLAARLACRIGPRRMLPVLAALKVRGLSTYRSGALGTHPMPRTTADVGERHRRAGGAGNLRAAVFGVNDGLVSNASLILGVVGASATDPRTTLLAGVAGLLAGAFSMAAGEYVSVRSQRELFEFQIGEERAELARYPDEEAEELALIYEARGLPIEQARAVARKLLEDPEHALDTLAREELGLDPDQLGSPIGAAVASFAAFAAGALVPLLPFVFSSGSRALATSIGCTAVGLFAVGAVLSLFSGRSAWSGGLRMLGIGAAAGAATWAIGSWIGVGVA